VALQNQRKAAEKEKAGPKGKDPLFGDEIPGMGVAPGGMAGPGSGMPGIGGPPAMGGYPGGMAGPPGAGMPGMSGPSDMAGGSPKASRPLAEELKGMLGEGNLVSELGKKKESVFPQLAGTWLATKAIIKGIEVPVADAESKIDHRIWMVCHGDFLYLTQAANPEYDPFNKVIFGSGNPVPFFANTGKDGWYFRMDYEPHNAYKIIKFMRENAGRRGQQSVNPALREMGGGKSFNPIYSHFDLNNKVLRMAFSEKGPVFGGGQEQFYFEFKRVSESVPNTLGQLLEDDLFSIPFRSIQSDLSESKVSGINGTWKMDDFTFKGKSLDKKLIENLILVSEGKSLLIMDATAKDGPLSKRKVIGMGRLYGWEGVQPGYFELQVSIPSPINDSRSMAGMPVGGNFVIRDNRIELSFLEIGIPGVEGQHSKFPPIEMKGHRIPDDPVASLANEWILTARDYRFGAAIFNLIRESPFPFTRPLEIEKKIIKDFWCQGELCHFPTLGELLDSTKLDQKGRIDFFGSSNPDLRLKTRVFEKVDSIKAFYLRDGDFSIVSISPAVERGFAKIGIPLVTSHQKQSHGDKMYFVEVLFPENATREEALALKEKILASGLPLDELVVHFSNKASDELVEPIRPKKAEAGKEKNGPVKPEGSQPKPKEGAKEPGKGKDITAGKEQPEKAAEGKEKGQ
jgi:hypothetical protein